jgi:kynurenine formamidase
MPSPERARLIDLALKSKIYDLGQPYFNGMPVHPADPPFQIVLYRYHEQTWKLFQQIAPGFSDSLEFVVTSMHSGTHLDSLCHISRNGKLYGGVTASDLETHAGYKKMGIDEAPLFTKRGILIDIPASKHLDILPPRYEISPEDIEAALKFEDVEIHGGEAILIRTGWSRYLTTDGSKYLHDFAGITADTAKHLASKKISLAGADNLAFGVPNPFEVHLVFLVDNGIYMMKSLNLEDLSKDEKYESLLVVAPLKIKGATGSLVRPIAIA